MSTANGKPEGEPVAYIVKGPYRMGDRSFKFDIILMKPSPVIGGVPNVIGIANIHADNDKSALALAQALINVAQQLPPELALAPA